MHGSFSSSTSNNKTRPLARKARRPVNSVSRMLAAAVSNGLESLESRQLMTAGPLADAGNPYVVNEGSSIVLDGSASIGATGYKWDLNYNGQSFNTTVTGKKFTYKAADNFPGGARQIALRVNDANNNVDTIVTTLTVNDVAPTVTLVGDANVDEGKPYALAWSATDPGKDTISSWIVDWNDGSNPETFGGATKNGTHVYAAAGSYTIAFTAVDEDGPHAGTTKSVTVAPVLPVVTASGAATVDEGSNYTVNFSATKDPVETWVIDWGDDNTDVYTDAELASADHAYADDGDFVVNVTGISADGDQGSATVNVSVKNVIPTVVYHGTPSVSIDEGTTVHQTLTVNDPGADTFTYAWSVKKDGQPYQLPGSVNTTLSDFTWIPRDNGKYCVTVVVTDDDGGERIRNSKVIDVTNVAPTGNVSGAPGGNINEGDLVTLTANPSDAGDDDTFTYAWTVKKGANSYALPGNVVLTNKTLAFAPGDEGTYVATVVIKDKDGATVSAQSAAITAVNVAPVAVVNGAPANALEGDEIEASAGVTDAGRDDEHTYQWSVEKGSPSTALRLNSGTGSNSIVANALQNQTFSLWVRPDENHVGQNTLFYLGSNSGRTLRLDVTDNQDAKLVFFGGTQTDATVQLIPGEWNHIALVSDNDNLTATLYINGQLAATATDIASHYPGPNTYFVLGNGNSSPSDVDDLAIYDTLFDAAAVSDLNDDTSTETPIHRWDFENFTVNPNNSIQRFYDDVSPNNALLMFNNASDAPGRGAGLTPLTLPGGTVTTNKNFTFKPTDNGTYRLKLTVTDKDGGTVDAISNDIVVANVAPEAKITDAAPTTGKEGTALSFGSASTDVGAADVASLAHTWSVKKDGVNFTLPGNVVTNAATFTFTPTDDGTYVVTYTVTDKDGGTDSTTASVEVANVDPVSAINGAPSNHVNEGSTVNLTSVVTDAGAADTVFTYAWSIKKDGNDYTPAGGLTSNLSTLSFVPGDNGEYVVKLVATDKNGGKGEKSVTVNVDNANPTAVVSGEPVGTTYEGAPVTLSVAGSDVADDTLSYAWSVKKDGEDFELPGTVATDATSFTFTPTDDGEYVATVIVSDEDGGSVTKTSAAIVVSNKAPVVNVTAPGTGTEGTKLTVGSTVTDAGNDELDYAWNVEKQVGGNAGKAIFSQGPNYGSVSGFAISNAFTMVARVTLLSSDNSGVIASSEDYDGNNDLNGWRLIYDNGSGTPTISLITASGGLDTTISTTQAVPVDQAFDLAFVYNANQGTVSLYIDGQAVALAGGVFVVAPSPTLAVGVALDSEMDSLAFYNAVLNDADVAALHDGDSIAAAKPYDWQFNDADGSQSAANTGTQSGGTMGFLFAGHVSNPASWAPVTLPSSVETDGETLEFVPTDNGTYRATLTVTDSGNLSASKTSSNIVVANAAPTATVTGVDKGSEGLAITLGTDAKDAGTDDTLAYAWSVKKGNANFGVNGSTSSYTFTPDNDGSYVVTLVVTDDDGGTVTTTKTIAVSNLDPTVAITGAPTGSVNEGSPITLGSTSSDVAGDELTFKWSVTKTGGTFTLPEDQIDDAEDFTFTPTDNGEYVVKLVVTDEDGGKAEKTKSITVANVAPTGTIDGAPEYEDAYEGLPATLTAHAHDVGADDTFTYAWSVTKDGKAYALPGTVNVKQASLSFVPSDNGTYLATCVIKDDDGLTTSVESEFEMFNRRPTATVTGAPTTANEGDTVSASATVVDAGTDDTHTYQWGVEKLVNNDSTTPGTLDAQNGGASLEGYNLGSATTIHAKFKVVDEGISANFPRNFLSIYSDDDNGFDFWISGDNTKGYKVGFTTYVNSVAKTVSTTANLAGIAGRYVDIVCGVDSATGAISLSVDGTAAVTGTVGVGFPTSGNSAVGNDFMGKLDSLAIYNSKLGDADLAKLASGQSVTALPQDAWDFNEVASANQQTMLASSGTQHTAIAAYSQSLSHQGAQFSAYTLPGTVKTDGKTFAFKPVDDGKYRITLIVTDKDGGTDTTRSQEIVVANVAPTATINGATTGNEGAAVALTSTAADAGKDDTLTYAWSVKKGNVAYTLPGNVVTNAAGFNFTPVDNGTYSVSLTVTDKDGSATQAVAHTVTVANVAPTATIAVTGTPVEASPLTFTATAADVGTLDTFTYAWSVKKDGQDYAVPPNLIQAAFEIVISNPAVFTFTPNDNGVYVVSCVVTDKDGGTVTATKQVTVANVAPTGTISTAPAGVLEGGTATLSVTATDVAGAKDTISYLWSVERGGKAYALPASVLVNKANFSFVPTDNGSYVATCVVSDEDGGSISIKSTAFTVANVAPTLSLTGGTTKAIRNQAVSFVGTASDAGSEDTFSYAWNFGDGSKINGGTTRSHAYTAPGTYTVSMTATDKDGDSVTQTQSVTVSVVNIVTDPADATKTALVIGGTDAADNVKLYAISANRVKVLVEGVTIGTYTITGNIYVYAGNGDNNLTSQREITNPIYAFGGTGRDTLIGASGADVLLGGGNNDALFGWAGNDVLIGGEGADSLEGEAGDDLLVAGASAFDADLAKLTALGRSWGRTDYSYTARVANVRGSSTLPLAGNSVFSDTSIDKLTGGDNRDWFFATTTGTASSRDTIVDFASNETLN